MSLFYFMATLPFWLCVTAVVVGFAMEVFNGKNN